jgi:hypothetical protein
MESWQKQRHLNPNNLLCVYEEGPRVHSTHYRTFTHRQQHKAVWRRAHSPQKHSSRERALTHLELDVQVALHDPPRVHSPQPTPSPPHPLATTQRSMAHSTHSTQKHSSHHRTLTHLELDVQVALHERPRVHSPHPPPHTHTHTHTHPHARQSGMPQSTRHTETQQPPENFDPPQT